MFYIHHLWIMTECLAKKLESSFIPETAQLCYQVLLGHGLLNHLSHLA
jgi:hypothetical protein